MFSIPRKQRGSTEGGGQKCPATLTCLEIKVQHDLNVTGNLIRKGLQCLLESLAFLL